MSMSLGIPELIILLLALVLPLIALAIAALCWVWMKRSRGSQRRFEDQNEQVIRLLEQQNELLKQMMNDE